MTFLVADDNPILRKMITAVLASPANNFFECSNGKDAVSCFQKYHPDWVIMDIEMDIMDGITASKEILKQNHDAKIVVLTQYNDKFLQQAAFACGVKEYFLKENLTSLANYFNSSTFINKIT